MKKSKILLPLTLAFVATASGAIAASNVKAAAEDTFKMVEGSSIQVRINQDTNKYGIKFAAEVGTPVEGATYNMMIVPATYVDAYNKIDGAKKDLAEFMLDAKAANKDMPLAIATDLEVENGRIEGSIVDIRWENLSEQFVGAAYYTLADGTVKCAALATDGTRSVVDVATKALQSGDYAANETVTGVLKGFVYNAIQEKLGTKFEDKDVEGKEANISFAEATKSVYVGDTITVNYTPYVAADMATWSSTVESVATVENGVITAKAEGTTTINVSLLDLTASYTLEVKKPTIENAKVTGATVTWDAIDGANYVVTLNGEAQPAQTENSFTLTQDGVYDISVAATKNGVTGEATVVAEDYFYNADGITYAGAKSFSFTELTNTKGSFTIEANNPTWQKGAAVSLAKSYANEFLKVKFNVKADGTKVGDLGFAIGMRGKAVAQGATEASELANGGYFTAWYNPVDTWGLMRAGAGMTYKYSDHNSVDHQDTNIYSNINLASLPMGDYYMLSGVMTKHGNTTIFCALLDSNETLLKLTSWDATKLGIGSVSESGCFGIYYYGAEAATLSYEVVEDITDYFVEYDKPIVKYSDGMLSWNMVSWAEGYKLSLDGGDTWKDVNTVNYELPNYGLYNVQLKAYAGETESAVSTVEAAYTEDDITFSEVSGVSFTTLNHSEGEITYTGYSNGWTASAITLKKSYTNEFIKVSFKATATSVKGNGIEIGYRQSKATIVRHNEWSMMALDFGSCIMLNYSSNSVLDYCSKDISGATGVPICYNSAVNVNTGLVVGSSYYYLAGVLGTGANATFYMGLFAEDDTPIRLFSFNWTDVYNRNNKAAAVADSGYFTIWNSCTDSRKISYEIIEDASSLLSVYEYPTITRNGTIVSWNTVNWAEGYKVSVNGGDWMAQTANSYTVSDYGLYTIKVKAYKGSTESSEASISFVHSSTEVITGKVANISAYSEATDGTKSFTFTPDSTVATSGHQSRSTASITENVKYGDAFLKVGFEATSSCLMENYLNITIRSTSTTIPDPVESGSYNFLVACFSASNMNVSPEANNKHSWTHWGSDHASLTVGNDYYIIAGIVTNADSTRSLYFLVTEKQADGSETLVRKFAWSFETIYAKTGVEIADEGYFVVSSWLAGERTLTYKVITDTTEMNNYINM